MARLSKPGTAVDALSLSDAVQMWRRSLQAANAAPRTITQYMYALRVAGQVLADREVASIRRTDVEALVADLQGRGWRPATVSTVWRPLRAFFNWAVAHPDVPLTSSPMEGMRPPAVPVVPAAFPTPEELRRVLDTCRTTSRHAFRARRDEAIIRLMATTGVRLAEASGLRLGDLDLTGPAPCATVLGKGRRVRSVPLDAPTLRALTLYLRHERPRSPFAGSTDRVWLAPRGPMTDSGIAQMVSDRAARVGVALHPHALRHFAAHTMLSAPDAGGRGMSEGDVMAVGGWSTPAMLHQRYGARLRAARADHAFRAVEVEL